MFKVIRTRRRQGYRTHAFPAAAPVLPARFRGRPVIDAAACPSGCRRCAAACPSGAIEFTSGAAAIDMGRCLFCTACQEACPEGALRFTGDWRLAARRRSDLVTGAPEATPVAALGAELRRLLGRSLKLRQVSAGGCNACEADTNVLSTLVFDLGRFGIQFVASPRHADGLLVTGPVTANMRLALEKTYAAVPEPKIVIATGACAISGGPYIQHPEAADGVEGLLPVDLYIPGCPPHPWTILDGLLRLLGRPTPAAAPPAPGCALQG
jgi:Ni,Fe-hydrogenase III small subunit/Pyruvate/2-oxoacid:ferredoxin oxidoreductase delta subunit